MYDNRFQKDCSSQRFDINYKELLHGINVDSIWLKWLARMNHWLNKMVGNN